MGFNLLLTQNKGKIIHCFEKKYGRRYGQWGKSVGLGKNVCNESAKGIKSSQRNLIAT